MYNILIEFGIPRKLLMLIKLCVNEIYSINLVGSRLSDMFPFKNDLKQGDALLPLLFSFFLEYTIRRVQINQDGFKLNDTQELLFYVDYVNIM